MKMAIDDFVSCGLGAEHDFEKHGVVELTQEECRAFAERVLRAAAKLMCNRCREGKPFTPEGYLTHASERGPGIAPCRAAAIWRVLRGEEV